MGARDITVREQGDSDTDVDIQDPYEGPTLAPGDYDTDVDMEDLCKSPTPAPAPTLGFAPATYYNLAVKQKAIYQPTFKHRCWMEGQKSVVPDGIESTSDIETKLPSQRSGGVSLAIYLTELEKVQGRLNEFYNGNNRLMKHKWDRLLNVLGGSIDRKGDEVNKVVIEIRLGKFRSRRDFHLCMSPSSCTLFRRPGPSVTSWLG
ncbi:hypothetical protein BC939DRAFT_482080 [Gamsiella multidivaricata]|uniref:uncharacterized protein n=1 Tax=Gamsiella multidivaricata TaxID=101098 RepID=UPI00221F4A16|nr:uncharacterized protein BC939DRAFT_482080 [Gamsiella multidivaricata]KAI7816380.1 hypothetical protein BC939DRAFT_482080 [Gamsiella multidivaricata]